MLLIACSAAACVAQSQVTQEGWQFILIVEGLDNLKALIRMYNLHVKNSLHFAVIIIIHHYHSQ